MDINQITPRGFRSWTEYYHYHESLLSAKTWLDGILASAILLVALSIDAIVDAIL